MNRRHTIFASQDGATIVEFALVAPVLIFLLFAIIEFSLIAFVSSVVEGATFNAARMARTGADRSHNLDPVKRAEEDKAYIRRLILERGDSLINSDHLVVSITPQVSPVRDTVGGPGEYVLYQTTYDWQVTTPFLGDILTSRPDHVYTITARTMVVNEPFK